MSYCLSHYVTCAANCKLTLDFPYGVLTIFLILSYKYHQRALNNSIHRNQPYSIVLSWQIILCHFFVLNSYVKYHSRTYFSNLISIRTTQEACITKNLPTTVGQFSVNWTEFGITRESFQRDLTEKDRPTMNVGDTLQWSEVPHYIEEGEGDTLN